MRVTNSTAESASLEDKKGQGDIACSSTDDDDDGKGLSSAV
jgi:hypothetical protein